MNGAKSPNGVHQALKVLLVDGEPGRAAILERALLDAGYELVSRLPSVDHLNEHVQRLQPDVVIIDIEFPDRDCFENMASVSRTNPRPIVMLAEESDDLSISLAIQSGVSAYLANDIPPERVRPIIQVAVARFREFQALQQELQATKDQLADRKLIDKAKGLLMKHRKFSEDEAYHAMRKLAMERKQKLADTAKSVIEVFDLLNGGGGGDE